MIYLVMPGILEYINQNFKNSNLWESQIVTKTLFDKTFFLFQITV